MTDPRVDRLRAQWDNLANADALWAVLTVPGKSDRRWDVAEFFATGEEQVREALADLNRLGIQVPEGPALDFGCGVGRLTQPLARRFGRATGLDVSPRMIDIARSLDTSEGRASFRVNDSARLEGVPSGSVAFVYSFIVLQHIPPVLAYGYIGEFVRVLMPGGVAIFQVPDRPTGLRSRAKATIKWIVPRAVMSRLLARLRGGRTELINMYAVPRAEVTRLVTEAGGRVVSTEPDDSAGRDWSSFRYVVVKSG